MSETDSQVLLEPELLARLRTLRLRSRERLSGALVGRHKSRRRGSSSEFAEHKEYSAGDDIRRLDWRAYAKVNRYYIKQFEDETHLRAFLVVDSSGSMGYGDGDGKKLTHASRLAGAIGYLLLRDQDSVGLIAYNDRVTEAVPPRSDQGAIQELFRTLSTLRAEGPTLLTTGLTAVLEQARRRSIIVVLSDLFEENTEFLDLLSTLSRRHDVLLLHVLHPDEMEFPFERMHLFRSMEDASELMAEPEVIRDAYLREMQNFIDGCRRRCINQGIRYALVPSGGAIDEQLSAVLGEKG